MKKRISQIAVILFLSTGLGGCQIGVSVTVSGSASAPVFQIQEDGFEATSPPVFGDFSITTKLSGKWVEIWGITKSNQCSKATSQLVYGKLPAQFELLVGPEPLKEGEKYEADVGGCGRTGSVSFKIEHGKLVTLSRDGFN